MDDEKIKIRTEIICELLKRRYMCCNEELSYIKVTSTGHREMPANLSSYWHQGSFPSVYKSINYHFDKHKSGIGSSNICAYVRSAQGFKSNLSGATSFPVHGSTPNVTRYKKNGRFIDIYGTPNTGKIISYGR